jgi:alkylated DNA repair dioxygenase AlkB
LNSELKQNNFLYIPNFISYEKAKKLEDLFYELEKKGLCDKDQRVANASSTYNFSPFLELLCEKVNEVSKLIEKPVLPTYTYARIYKNGNNLLRHQDREACEISISLHLGGDADWGFGIKKPNGEEVILNLKVGDAIIYLGCIAEHWRDKSYTGKNYCQVFLHYVISNGLNAWAYFDKKR